MFKADEVVGGLELEKRRIGSITRDNFHIKGNDTKSVTRVRPSAPQMLGVKGYKERRFLVSGPDRLQVMNLC